MPTMTNPETGETKEISMEEFMKMMRSGNGSLQQVVKHADGTTSSTTVYGNVAADGLDRSVNIFVDRESFNAFLIKKIKKLTGEIEDPESEKDPDDLFEMTVDFTESAIMGILKATKEELTINLYTRDERKATFDHLKQGSKSWKYNPDRTIEFNGADLQGDDKTVSLYMLAFLEMRQFLRATGKLAELKDLGNRGAGVILKATGLAEDAKATIVRGRNRPDLPCNMFLFGEQMMRPYMDEMMTDAMMSGMSLDEKIEAAEGGDPDIMEHLAQMYLNGDDVAQDFEKSAYWWEKLANTGNATGQFNIGLYYAKGCGVKRDFAKAAEWMKKSAENGDDDAPNAAAMYDSAAEKLKKAESGDPAAQAEVAKLYTQLGGSLEQFGTQSDYEEAFKWAKKAADQGDLDGLYCLALCYEHGRGTVVAKTKAAATYEKAAKMGHAPSQWNLAVCYLNGSGYERNEVKGYMWAYQAADQGNELAINGLSYQEKTLNQIIETYRDPETDVVLEGTQYEGRADRCERIKTGTELTHKITKDKNGDEVIELFYNGGTVGLLSKWNSAALLALLKLDRIKLVVKVKSCIPKSKRGARARNADVHLNLLITAKKPETPEERAERLAREEAERVAEEARKRKEAEEKARLEEERKKAEKLRKEKEAAEKAEAERIARQKAKELQDAANKMRGRYIAASGMIASSLYHVVALKPDGTVIATGKNDNGQCNVSGWRNVIAVACDTNGTVGLTAQGTVLYTGSTYHRQNQCTSWRNIKEIAISNECIFGLRHDGTVVATTEGNNGAHFSTKPDVTAWRNIVAIRAGQGNVLGIKSDGSIVAIQRNYYGRCEEDYYLDGKTNAQDAAFGYLACGVVLHKDGKCTSAGTQYSYVMSPTEINKHSGIVKIDMFSSRPIAILADGTLVVEPGKNDKQKELERFISKHNIKKVVAVSCDGQFAVLTEDGRVFVKCDSTFSPITDEECFGKNFRLFNDFHKMMDAREAEAERIRKEREEQERLRKEEERRRADRRQNGLCQYCGGTFKKVLFGMKCTSCGTKKDYK